MPVKYVVTIIEEIFKLLIKMYVGVIYKAFASVLLQRLKDDSKMQVPSRGFGMRSSLSNPNQVPEKHCLP